MVSGSVEVTARLKTAEDLELLLKVLEANKALFTKANTSEIEVLPLDRSPTQHLAKAPPSEDEVWPKVASKHSKSDQSKAKPLANGAPSEADVLTLT